MHSVTEILKPPRDVNNIDKEFLFDALKQTICAMYMAERQLTRGRISRIVHSKDVKEVEKKVEELIQRLP